MPFKMIIIANDEDLKKAYAIRTEVFVQEQKVPLELEMDADDHRAVHILGSMDDEAVACGRIVMDQEHAHIGRVAVKKDHRGKGLGKKLMQYMIKVCQDLGARDIILHSQVQAIPFYTSLGFHAYGDAFLDAGIEHRAMKMEL